MNDAALAIARASKNFLATRIEMPFQPLEGHHTHHLANPGAIPKSAGTNTISDVLSHPLNKKVDEIFNPTYLRGVIAYAKVPVGMR